MKRFFAALTAVLCLIFAVACTNQKADGQKHITVNVIDDKKQQTEFTYDTDKEMLGDVLTEAGLIAGEEGQYGLYVKTVNGLTVNDSNEEWWCLTKGGETVMTGIDLTPIADGDVFELTFTVGY